MVIAGNSPYTKFLKAKLLEKYNCRVVVVDMENGSNSEDITYLKDSPDNFVYIINSTQYLGFYSRILMGRGITQLIPYHALPVLDDELDYSRKAYSAAFFRSGNRSIIQNKEEYRELLLSMSDDESSEIMARLICYMLTADYKYAPVPHHKELYFNHDFLKLTADEICVDGGGFNGDTLDAYLGNHKSFVHTGYLSRRQSCWMKLSAVMLIGIIYTTQTLDCMTRMRLCHFRQMAREWGK